MLLDIRYVFGFFLQRVRRILRDTVINVRGPSRKGPVIIVRFLIKQEFSGQFKNTQISNFMKIRSGEAELFYAERQTDRHDEANSRFFAIVLF
jgi:hypothetical protein